MANLFKRAQIVVTPRGVGMIVRVSDLQRRIVVKFGADGPQWNFWIKRNAIRHATNAEIKAAGLDGVGREESAVAPLPWSKSP